MWFNDTDRFREHSKCKTPARASVLHQSHVVQRPNTGARKRYNKLITSTIPSARPYRFSMCSLCEWKLCSTRMCRTDDFVYRADSRIANDNGDDYCLPRFTEFSIAVDACFYNVARGIERSRRLAAALMRSDEASGSINRLDRWSVTEARLLADEQGTL